MTELELITALGAHDAVLDDLDKKIAAQEARVVDAQAALAAARDALSRAEGAVKDSKEVEHGLSRNVRLYEQRKAAATRALEGGHGDPDAAERQLAQCAEILDDLETQQLEQMEVSEEAAQGVVVAKAAVAEAEAALQVHKDEAPPQLKALGSARAAAQLKRDGVWEQLPVEVQNRYGLIRAKRRTAVSRMVDGYCSACRKKVPLAEGAEVRKGRVRSCSSCGRYLVLPQAD